MIIVNKPMEPMDVQCSRCNAIFSVPPMMSMNAEYVTDCALHKGYCQHESDGINCPINKCMHCGEFYK